MKTQSAAIAPRQNTKLFYRINEVAELTGIKPYVLRYWETEFPELAPEKDASDHRRYRAKDIRIVLAIRKLLYEDRFTIKGARHRLKEEIRRMAAEEDAAPLTDQAPVANVIAIAGNGHAPENSNGHSNGHSNGYAKANGNGNGLALAAAGSRAAVLEDSEPEAPELVRNGPSRTIGETLNLLRGEVNELLQILSA